MNAAECALTNERWMRKPVCAWLVAQGFLPVFEVCISCRQADIVAGRFEGRSLVEAVAVELKLSAISEVIEQAAGNARTVGLSYAAMPVDVVNGMREATFMRFANAGIGLLAVSQEDVEEAVAPQRGLIAERHRASLEKRLWRRRNEYLKA